MTKNQWWKHFQFPSSGNTRACVWVVSCITTPALFARLSLLLESEQSSPTQNQNMEHWHRRRRQGCRPMNLQSPGIKAAKVFEETGKKQVGSVGEISASAQIRLWTNWLEIWWWVGLEEWRKSDLSNSLNQLKIPNIETARNKMNCCTVGGDGWALLW